MNMAEEMEYEIGAGVLLVYRGDTPDALIALRIDWDGRPPTVFKLLSTFVACTSIMDFERNYQNMAAKLVWFTADNASVNVVPAGCWGTEEDYKYTYMVHVDESGIDVKAYYRNVVDWPLVDRDVLRRMHQRNDRWLDWMYYNWRPAPKSNGNPHYED